MVTVPVEPFSREYAMLPCISTDPEPENVTLRTVNAGAVPVSSAERVTPLLVPVFIQSLFSPIILTDCTWTEPPFISMISPLYTSSVPLTHTSAPLRMSFPLLPMVVGWVTFPPKVIVPLLVKPLSETVSFLEMFITPLLTNSLTVAYTPNVGADLSL